MADTGLIETYLNEVGAGLAGRHSARVLAEIEDHLRERTADLMREHDPEVAERKAIAAFGDPDLITSSFNDIGGAMPSKFTRWSGLAGMLGVILLFATFVQIGVTDNPNVDGDPPPPILLPVSGLFLLTGFAGLVARTRGAFGRWRGSAILVTLAAGAALLPFAWGAAGWVDAALFLLALGLICHTVFREDVLPRPATTLMFVSIVTMSILAPTSLDKQSMPYYLGFAALLIGWIWLQYTLWSERPERPAPSMAPA